MVTTLSSDDKLEIAHPDYVAVRDETKDSVVFPTEGENTIVV